jgi:serine/threonine protein kinase
MADSPSKTNANAPSEVHDEQLAEMLTEFVEIARRGETPDWSLIARQKPELVVELKQLWGTSMMADAVALETSRFAKNKADPSTGSGKVRDPLSTEIELPAPFGDYELREVIGRGGMGIVYRAWQMSLDREVAVKMLLRGQLASPTDERRFRHEAESAARLQHPGIVPVYETGQINGRLFFSMRYIRGETLAKILLRGPMEPRQAASILASVCRAVHFAHENGVIHRDLKPSNILLDETGYPHVSDFGLASRVTDQASLTRTGAILGTPAYMAPEQAAGSRGQIGPASDVYSIGTILYHMLTGRPPFQAATPVDIVFQVLEQDPPPLRSIHPRADRDLSLVALRCLQKPPDLRYESAAALADDLEAYLRDEPVTARSGHFGQIISRLFRETHHAAVLNNWGLLWMWHSLALLVVCVFTNTLLLLEDDNRVHYFLLWTAGLGTWAGVFWWLRRRLGPVTFVERQIAHIWGASMIGIALLFPLEHLMELKVLTLSPVVAVAAGMVFFIKAGVLSGTFYLQAMILFLTALVMSLFPRISHFIFGIVGAACFFVPGLKYYRQRLREEP